MKGKKELLFLSYKLEIAKILCLLCLFGGTGALSARAQSTSVEYPTAVTTNEITGRILARDLGDARLTAYYYTFNGSQGDIFINVSASNFNGDFDVFIAEGLRPLTKISFYSDSSVTETGRVIYLRKPEKLILRVEGRSPDDNPATFRIKFAGSFVAAQDNGQSQEPKLPEVKTENTSGIRVNSVGTIIRPAPTPETKERVAQNKTNDASETGKNANDSQKAVADNPDTAAKTDDSNKSAETKNETEKEAVVKTPKRKTPARSTRNAPRRTTPSKAKTTTTRAADKTTKPAPTTPKPDPLENVRLIVLMKDGERIEFPMTEVFRFSLNNGILTIITKDGKIHRKSILDIQKFTVE